MNVSRSHSDKSSGATNSRKRLKSDHKLSGLEPNVSGFFSGCNFYIFPTGIGNARRTIFENQAVKNGGNLSKSINKDVTHIIVDESITLEKLLSVLKWTTIPAQVTVVRTQWFSNCIKNNESLETDEFELCGVRTKKAITENFSSGIKASKKAAQENNEESVNIECAPSSLDISTDKQTELKGKWICAISSNQNSENFNKHITDKLEVLSTVYKNTRDHWRSLGYEKAIMALKNHPKPITSWEEAKSLRGVGDRLADKIWEIVQSGNLRKIDEVCSEKRVKAISLFNQLWGCGPSTAEMFIEQGFYTLEDLKAKAKLTKAQQIGLKYFEEFQDRMPRSEAAEIISMVNSIVASLDPLLQSVACGSFRRGRETCGDIDILITHPDSTFQQGILPKLVSSLHDTNILTDDLVSQEENGSHKKYMGVCKLPYGDNKHRRIDIISVPLDEYACALMHFTGSANFNRSIRLLASKRGMSLSEHSLRAGVVREGTKKVSKGYALKTPTEESIFKHMGLDFRSPEERDHFAVE